MKITKLGHCCLKIEVNGISILTDPGSYSPRLNEVTGIDIILITHEHADHLHIESLKSILRNNPTASVVTNGSVAKIVDKESITSTILSHGNSATLKGIGLEGFGKDHAPIYQTYGLVENTGYFIDDKLFYPGDAFYDPKKKVEVLALPISGPWMQLSHSIEYAMKLQPCVCFPVHDGMLREDRLGPTHRIPEQFLKESGTQFVPMLEGSVTDF